MTLYLPFLTWLVMSLAPPTACHRTAAIGRNQRFRDGHVFRLAFEHVVKTCMLSGLIGGKGFAVDASLIAADANKCRSTPGNEWSHDIDPDAVGRAVQDYLNALDDPAWGAATRR